MSKSIRAAILGVVVVAFTMAAFVGGASAQVSHHAHTSALTKKGTVAWLGPETFTGRWVKDRQDLDKELKKLDKHITIINYNANASISTQIQDANDAESSGAKVLILAAVDQYGDAPIVNQAESHGIKVLGYDRMIQSPKLRAYDSFYNPGVGTEQGTWFKNNVPSGKIVEILGSSTDHNEFLFNSGFQSVVGPLSGASKKYQVCYSTTTPNWTPATAGTEMDSAYTDCGTNIKGVYSMNDGMAADIYASINRHHESGLPLTGQDAQPDGLGRILKHEQGMTVFKNVKFEADSAAQVAANWINGKGLPKNYKKSCGIACAQADGHHVPSALFTPESITLGNVADPVKAGFDTWGGGSGVCASVGINSSAPYCGLPH